MKIAIIVAMEKELNLLLSELSNHTETDLDGITVYTGLINGHEVVACKCGIGKVNAALRTQRVLHAFEPELVINSGVAGGTDNSMKIGEVLVADGVAYHDVWCGPGTEYGAADGFPRIFTPWKHGADILKSLSESNPSDTLKFGLLCSGDKFISTPDEVKEIKSHFPEALGCDMESAAIAQTCMANGVSFMVVRVMSDMPGGGENLSEYQNFWNEAPASTFRIVKSLINSI